MPIIKAAIFFCQFRSLYLVFGPSAKQNEIQSCSWANGQIHMETSSIWFNWLLLVFHKMVNYKKKICMAPSYEETSFQPHSMVCISVIIHYTLRFKILKKNIKRSPFFKNCWICLIRGRKSISMTQWLLKTRYLWLHPEYLGIPLNCTNGASQSQLLCNHKQAYKISSFNLTRRKLNIIQPWWLGGRAVVW